MAEIFSTESSFRQDDGERSEYRPKNIEVITLTSKNGKEYQVGVPEGSEGEAVKQQLESSDDNSSGDNFTDAVEPMQQTFEIYWQPGREWQQTSNEFRNNTGIEGWQIRVGQHWPKDYTLWIHSNRAARYVFIDQEPDHYKLAVWDTDKDHYVDYDSRAPTMVKCIVY